MDNQDQLKSMLSNIINDKNTEAAVDFHGYLQGKMKDLTGTGVKSTVQSDETVDDDNEE